MTKAEWEARYYPKPAQETTKEEALDHSIRKWEGIQAVAVEGLHQRYLGSARLHFLDGEKFAPSAGTCALCVHYYNERLWERNPCVACPLCRVRGGVACESKRSDELQSPWRMWSLHRDAQPMLEWLRKAKEAENASKSEDHPSIDNL